MKKERSFNKSGRLCHFFKKIKHLGQNRVGLIDMSQQVHLVKVTSLEILLLFDAMAITPPHSDTHYGVIKRYQSPIIITPA